MCCVWYDKLSVATRRNKMRLGRKFIIFTESVVTICHSESQEEIPVSFRTGVPSPKATDWNCSVAC